MRCAYLGRRQRIIYRWCHLTTRAQNNNDANAFFFFSSVFFHLLITLRRRSHRAAAKNVIHKRLQARKVRLNWLSSHWESSVCWISVVICRFVNKTNENWRKKQMKRNAINFVFAFFACLFSSDENFFCFVCDRNSREFTLLTIADNVVAHFCATIDFADQRGVPKYDSHFRGLPKIIGKKKSKR